MSRPRHFAIVPAAGRSRRMGRAKLVLPFGESTVIETVIAAWQAGGVDQVVVVCRADDAPLIELVSRTDAIVVIPKSPPPEMKDSVAEALTVIADRFQPQPHDTWLMAPADIPRLSAAVIRHLIEAHWPDEPRIIVPAHNGRRGHPALFPWSIAAEVTRLGNDQGINALFGRYEVTEIECGPEALARDVDTKEEYDVERRSER